MANQSQSARGVVRWKKNSAPSRKDAKCKWGIANSKMKSGTNGTEPY